jgi:DNA-binding NarL/FixJ family response regulator
LANVVVLVDDLFFQSKIVETARQAGVELKLCSTGEAFLAELARAAPALAIVDLNARGNPLDAIERLQSTGNQVPLIGYLSHVQTELAERARAAGCREVMPRSKFSMNLAAILASAKAPGAKAGEAKADAVKAPGAKSQ